MSDTTTTTTTTAASSLSLKYVNDILLPKIADSHTVVKAAIAGLNGDKQGDIGEMLDIQLKMAAYTSMTDLSSTLIKQCGDTIKGIVQKTS
ncbi:EscF/YscF/HrpA family type III secretion system needle major subunit [Diaphorobacter nitroreducens]|uniref:EscF/YscF/HrpA family type III secretion system needle major subunit n=1 Tax=Diaphorobacter nitroreducens TaxID=164759 RepID=UPI0035B2ABEE